MAKFLDLEVDYANNIDDYPDEKTPGNPRQRQVLYVLLIAVLYVVRPFVVVYQLLTGRR